MHLLLVCTGNLCRSRLAEGLAHAWARAALGAAGSRVRIETAGTRARPGLPMEPLAAEALRRLGGEPGVGVSRTLTGDMATEADVVLTFTRQQRTQVLETAPRAMRRTFLLTEAVDLLRWADLTDVAASDVESRGRALAAALDRARALRPAREATGDLDVPDPMGQSAQVHWDVALEIAGLLRPLAACLFDGTEPASPGRYSAAEAER